MKKENMKKINLLIELFIILIVISICLAGCRGRSGDYLGEHPELYSVAINSVLYTRGYILSERRISPELTLLEEDSFGRKMFTYSENLPVSTYSLIIAQTNDDDYVYYYPDYNFISASKNHFPKEDREKLKDFNDWGKEIDINKCVRVEIVRKKNDSPISNTQLEELYNIAFREDGINNKQFTFLSTDSYGRSIYVTLGKRAEHNQSMVTKYRYMLLLFDPDGSYDESRCIMELTDLYNYQDDLKAFKERNDWNMPPE